MRDQRQGTACPHCGVPAARWYRLAAEQGDAEAQPQRRKVICVVQGIVLVVCLAPVTRPAPATALAAASLLLLLLVYSFVVDT